MSVTLEDELRPLLGVGYIVERVPVCMDIMWDADLDESEFYNASPAIVIRTIKGARQITLQRIRGELRYMLLSDVRENAAEVHDETGILETVLSAVALCDEYLHTSRDFEQLSSVRKVVRRG